jgi:hypothetical protein
LKLDFIANVPVYAAGRITLPPVCVPQLIGTWESDTVAADPAEDPLGVRVGSWGLVVDGPEFMMVNSVVVVLPVVLLGAVSCGDGYEYGGTEDEGAGSTEYGDGWGIGVGFVGFVEGRGVLCGHVLSGWARWITSESGFRFTFGVHVVFDADGYSMQWSPLIAWDLVEDACLVEDEFGIWWNMIQILGGFWEI